MYVDMHLYVYVRTTVHTHVDYYCPAALLYTTLFNQYLQASRRSACVKGNPGYRKQLTVAVLAMKHMKPAVYVQVVNLVPTTNFFFFFFFSSPLSLSLSLQYDASIPKVWVAFTLSICQFVIPIRVRANQTSSVQRYLRRDARKF